MERVRCKSCGNIIYLDEDNNKTQAYVFCPQCGYSSTENPYYEDN